MHEPDHNDVSREEFEKFNNMDLSDKEIKRLKKMFSVGEKRPTKKYLTAEQRRVRRAIQKASRKVNRGTGKGMKNTKGIRHRMN